MLKKNIGGIDRVVRVLVGLGAIGAGIYYQNWFGALGLVPLATAALGSCPLYTIIGVSTCPTTPAAKP
ncbi:MAG TPA: DUF2892 domain-containing protein [Candidatus Paceibacterota bacterium]|nr:DUF2892 domain-containing protein [Candidatus Paceibacterota bacterium]